MFSWKPVSCRTLWWGFRPGALHGCSYVAGQKGRSIRYYRKYRSDKHFMGLYSLLTTGDVVGTKFCYEDIPLRLDPFNEAAFEKAPVDFYVTVTNVRTASRSISCATS